MKIQNRLKMKCIKGYLQNALHHPFSSIYYYFFFAVIHLEISFMQYIILISTISIFFSYLLTSFLAAHRMYSSK